MKKVPKAITLIKNLEEDTIEIHNIHYIEESIAVKLMQKYAKLHVEAALKEASTKFDHYSNKDVILNSYPLDKIK
jgi:hypothetical protein